MLGVPWISGSELEDPGCCVLVTSQPHRSHIAVAYARLQIVERLDLILGICLSCVQIVQNLLGSWRIVLSAKVHSNMGRSESFRSHYGSASVNLAVVAVGLHCTRPCQSSSSLRQMIRKLVRRGRHPFCSVRYFGRSRLLASLVQLNESHYAYLAKTRHFSDK